MKTKPRSSDRRRAKRLHLSFRSLLYKTEKRWEITFNLVLTIFSFLPRLFQSILGKKF